MKKHLVFLSLISMFAVTMSLAYAAWEPAMRVNIPFDFYMGDQLMPAGMYHFQIGSGIAATASLIKVRELNGAGCFVLTTPASTAGNSDGSFLQFHKYGEKYFLSSIAIRNYRRNLSERTLEKELKAQDQGAQATILLASK
jgi:hypothetical protein